MRTVTEYKLVKFTNDKELENAVNGLIKMGWQPLGGVSIANEILDHCQAMVKYEKSA